MEEWVDYFGILARGVGESYSELRQKQRIYLCEEFIKLALGNGQSQNLSRKIESCPKASQKY